MTAMHPATTNAELTRLVAIKVEANRKYRQGLDSGLTDYEYDEVTEAIRAIDPSHPCLVETEDDGLKEDPITGFYAEKKLTLHMGSQSKALDPYDSDMVSFTHRTKGKQLHGSFKMDGMSVELTYRNGALVQALTKGDGEHGHDITIVVRNIPTIPATIPDPRTAVIRGEVFMYKYAFEKINEQLAKEKRDPLTAYRNGAVAICKTLKNAHLAKWLAFKAFDIEFID